MSFLVSGLPVETFRPLFGLADEDLAARGVLRYVADAPLGFPCRVALEDARPGESLLLLNYEHQPAQTPYRARHAIFVNESARETARYVDEIPPCLTARSAIALRAYDERGMMLDAALAPGAELEPLVRRLLAEPQTAYLHAHNAGRGCYAARIDRC